MTLGVVPLAFSREGARPMHGSDGLGAYDDDRTSKVCSVDLQGRQAQHRIHCMLLLLLLRIHCGSVATTGRSRRSSVLLTRC